MVSATRSEEDTGTRSACIGIDPSSRKIAATITFHTAHKIRPLPEVRVKFLPPSKPVEACLISFIFMRALVKEIKNRGYLVHVFIEEPVLGRGGARATIPQSKTHGAMLAGAASVTGTLVQGVNNQVCKKRVIGNGNADKAKIKEWCRVQWPFLYQLADGDQDVMDSAMICVYGEAVIEQKKRILDLQRKQKRPPMRKRSTI